MTFKFDCVYYETMRPEQYRAYCDKLNRVIKGKDCQDCGWYIMMHDAGHVGFQGRKDLTEKLKEVKK